MAKTIAKLMEDHPTWTAEMIKFVRVGEDVDQPKRESIMNVFCWKCEHPLGKHSFDNEGNVVCPK